MIKRATSALFVLLLSVATVDPARCGWEDAFVPTGFDAAPYAAAGWPDAVLLYGDFQRVGTEAMDRLAVFDGTDFVDVGFGLESALAADNRELLAVTSIGLVGEDVFVGLRTRVVESPARERPVYTRSIDGEWEELPLPAEIDDVPRFFSHDGRLVMVARFFNTPHETEFAFRNGDGTWERIPVPQPNVNAVAAPPSFGPTDGTPLYALSRITEVDDSNYPIQYSHTDALFRLDGDAWIQLRLDYGTSNGPAPQGGLSTYYEVGLIQSGSSLLRLVDYTGDKSVEAYDPIANAWDRVPAGAFEDGIKGILPSPDGFLAHGTSGGMHWIRHLNGEDWTVLAQSFDAAPSVVCGVSGDVFAFGPFGEVDGVVALEAARWSGGSWSALFDEASNPPRPVRALASFEGSVLVGPDGGPFPQTGTAVSSWDGVSWYAYPGLDARSAKLRTIEAQGDALWIGAEGTFDRPDTPHVSTGVRSMVWRQGVATEVGDLRGVRADWMYDGVPSDYVPAVVRAYAAFDGRHWAGGTFEADSASDASGLRGVATLNEDGSSWTNPPAGFPSLRSYDPWAPFYFVDVNALVVHGDLLVVGGHFELSGERAALAAFDGTSEVDVSGGLFLDDGEFDGDKIRREVFALASVGDALYVGGLLDADAPDAAHAHIVVRRDGVGTWASLGGGVDGPVYAIVPYEDGVLVGGRFSEAGGQPANSLAHWDGESWTPFDGGVTLASGEPGTVYALAVDDLDLHVGGEFVRAGSTVSANYAIFRGIHTVAIDDPQAPSVSERGRNRLVGSAPNPFNPATEIAFELATPGASVLRLFDAAGRFVRQFDLSTFGVGESAVTWRGLDHAGQRVSSGVYFVQLMVDGRRVDASRLVLVK